MLIIYVKLLRPGDYDGTPIASDKQVAWDRVAESFNDEFKMWKKQYPSINLTVNTRDGKSCRSRWKYHVSLMVGAPFLFLASCIPLLLPCTPQKATTGLLS